MKQYVLTLLAIMLSTAAIAQDSAPTATEKHITLPMPDFQVTNLFSKGYQTFGGKVSMVRVASRQNPERQHFLKVGDFVGNYRIDHVVGRGEDYELYLVKSNETVIIRARQPSETHKNTAEQSGPAYPP